MSFRNWLFFVLMLFLFTACYEKEEGCLDISATNFDVSADKPCPDSCCVYPSLLLNMQSIFSAPQQDTFYTFTKDKLFEVPGMPGDSFSLSRLRYFISDVELLNQGVSVTVSDEIDFFIFGNRQTYSDNFGVFEPGSNSNRTMGIFPHTGEFDQVRFRFGLASELVNADPDLIPSGHPFSLSIDSTMWDATTGYVSAYLELFRDEVATDSVPFQIVGEKQLDFFPMEPILVRGGENIQLNFVIDFYQWFSGIDPSIDDVSVMKQKIFENVSDSFLFLSYE